MDAKVIDHQLSVPPFHTPKTLPHESLLISNYSHPTPPNPRKAFHESRNQKKSKWRWVTFGPLGDATTMLPTASKRQQRTTKCKNRIKVITAHICRIIQAKRRFWKSRHVHTHLEGTKPKTPLHRMGSV